MFFIFQNRDSLLRYKDSKFPTSARKTFGVAGKRRVPAEKFSHWITKKANMFKAKRLIEKEGTNYLTTASTFSYSSKNSSAEYIHVFFIHVAVCMSVCVSESVCFSVWVSECEACWWSVNMFDWGIFRAVWKSRPCVCGSLTSRHGASPGCGDLTQVFCDSRFQSIDMTFYGDKFLL